MKPTSRLNRQSSVRRHKPPPGGFVVSASQYRIEAQQKRPDFARSDAFISPLKTVDITLLAEHQAGFAALLLSLDGPRFLERLGGLVGTPRTGVVAFTRLGATLRPLVLASLWWP